MEVNVICKLTKLVAVLVILLATEIKFLALNTIKKIVTIVNI